VYPQRTICEIHREAYDWCVCNLTSEQLNTIVPKLEEAYLLGIKLVKTLIDRKLALPDWERQNVAEAARLRQQRIEMEATLEASRNL